MCACNPFTAPSLAIDAVVATRPVLPLTLDAAVSIRFLFFEVVFVFLPSNGVTDTVISVSGPTDDPRRVSTLADRLL